MALIGWTLYLLLAAAAAVVVGFLYRRRETPGRGRTLLAALRWAALAVLLLLLFNPEIPTQGIAGSRSASRVLVDASLSMQLPVGQGETTTRWQRASEEARTIARGRDAIVFGDAVRVVPTEVLPDVQPEAATSQLMPALRVAAEAGARRVVVLTDGQIDDAAEVARTLPTLGVELEFRSMVDGQLSNRAVTEVQVPSWAEASEPVDVQVGVRTTGEPQDSLTVVLREQDRILAQSRIAAPAPGLVGTTTLSFTPDPGSEGQRIRYEVALASGEDEVGEDDTRSVYMNIGEEPAGVAIVSFRPDWEPRFLQPVLEQALGLPVRGYLRADDDRYVRIGAGAEAGQSASDEQVASNVAEAELVVLHGLGGSSPAWARRAAENRPRVLVFPDDEAGELGLPVRVGSPTPGDWYASPTIPSSPVASLLAGLPIDNLAPLSRVRSAEGGQGAWTPVELNRDRRGAGMPILLAGDSGERRWAVALADGYWQWTFRDGGGREAYRRLWSAVGGWLIEDDAPVTVAAVQPTERAAPRGEPVRWVAPGSNADSIGVRVGRPDGTVVLDSVFPVVRGDTAVGPALPPGHYTYQARAFSDDTAGDAAEGPLTVERYAPDFHRPAVALDDWQGMVTASVLPGRPRGEPLHTMPWPYLLLAALLAAEWILRRRWGLR